MSEIERGSSDLNIEARERHVIGTGPRLVPVANEAVPESAWEQARRIRQASGGAPPKTLSQHLRTMVKHPEMFRCQLEQATALYAGSLPPRERELAVLRVGWLTRSPYEWGEHVAMGKRYGLTPDEIARVREGSSAAGWTGHEAAILAGAEELVGDFALQDATWETLASTYSEAQMIEFLILVGQYIANALLQNSLRIQLAEPTADCGRGSVARKPEASWTVSRS